MARVARTRYVATYRVRGYLLFGDGTIIDAQIPDAPGTPVRTNVDGYSGSGRSAWVFRGPRGRVVQWIKDETSASVCSTGVLDPAPGTGVAGPLRCTRPTPYAPSNGFAEMDTGFVPNYVREAIALFGSTPRMTRVTEQRSPRFGVLTCVRQTSTHLIQTTCVDEAGLVVSWWLSNGTGATSRATLVSVSTSPTRRDVSPLRAPTTPFTLPGL